MTVSVIRGSGSVSLEFAPEDRLAVRNAIGELFGVGKATPYVMSSTITVDGESFAYQNEWDDPCLITSTAKGAQMLQAIADVVGHTGI